MANIHLHLNSSKLVPNKKILREVASRLKAREISFALGGSALLALFGCPVDVHDWDITTDAPAEIVEEALNGIVFQKIGVYGQFASEYLFRIKDESSSIDIIGGFTLRTRDGLYRVPTKVYGEWEGIPVGDPEVWIKVYEILGQNEKSAMLRGVL